MKIFSNIYLTRWFFVVFAVIVLMYVTAYTFPALMFVANVTLASLFSLTLLDTLLVFSNGNPIRVERTVQERLNLGDENPVELKIFNLTSQPINFSLIEGYPVEMQDRSSILKGTMLGGGVRSFNYTFTPKTRGTFEFGDVFIIIRSLFLWRHVGLIFH